jgi:UDP-N-acetylmuramoyl-L-alanyl-D-glutamate--2,6-diaminopimelate ligase
MGEIATRLSDVTIITSDNPRSEDPASIIREILSGATAGATVSQEADRRKAIAAGLAMATRGDVVLIAGKGHETHQIVGEQKTHLDDREEVLKFLGKQWN